MSLAPELKIIYNLEYQHSLLWNSQVLFSVLVFEQKMSWLISINMIDKY